MKPTPFEIETDRPPVPFDERHKEKIGVFILDRFWYNLKNEDLTPRYDPR